MVTDVASGIATVGELASRTVTEKTTGSVISNYQVSTNDLTLVDYFVVVGYDCAAKLQLEPGFDYVSSSNAPDMLCVPPLERSYMASILSHFPEKRKSYPFPSEIVSLCLPKGLRFYTQNDVPAAAVHSFANMREDGSRVSGCALIFHEEVRDPQLCEQMTLLQTEHVRALTAHDKAVERAHVPPGTISGGTHTLPRGHKKNRSKRISFYDSSGSNSRLYISKCICLLCRIPFVMAGEQLLTALHSLFTSSNQPPPLPLESYIYWILNEVPLPAPSSSLKICLDHVDIVIQRPGLNELPFFDYPISMLFDLITIDKFLRLFTCFLLEHQILLCSRHLQRLMLVAESLCAFAFPFQWQLTYVPILPYSQLKFMEAPVPFVMGLCYEDCVPESLFQGNMCILNIDSGELNMPEDVPPMPDRAEFGREVASLLMRSNEESANIDGNVVKRLSAFSSAKEDWIRKRMSRSFDDETLPGMLAEDYQLKIVQRQNPTPLPLDDILKQSEVLAKVTAIARRAGVNVQMENIEKELQSNDAYTKSPVCQQYFKNMRINNSVREIFINRFAWLLYSYEHFVISGACIDIDTYFASRESVVNFDKAAFLSDQPDSNLPFLAAFLETQMFTSFIDAKILSQWQGPDDNLKIFDARIQMLREIYGLQMVRTPTYEKTPLSPSSDDAIVKREGTLDYIVPPPHELSNVPSTIYNGIFPNLNESVLAGCETSSPMPSPWKQRHRRLRPKTHDALCGNSVGTSPNHPGSYTTDTPRQIAHQNWKFVEQLLKETKGKTKRMLVDKMGKEALQIGYSDASVNGLEENTLVASFCDLLERVWAHGLLKKQGRSSLWAHILQHQEVEKLGTLARDATARKAGLTPELDEIQNRENIDLGIVKRNVLNEIAQGIHGGQSNELAAPGWSLSILRAANFIADKISSGSHFEYSKPSIADYISSSNVSKVGRSRSPQKQFKKPILNKANSLSDFAPYWTNNGSEEGNPLRASPRKRSTSRTLSPDSRFAMLPLSTNISHDLKNVLRMTDIKTDIGYARAFVRLALERKLLHRHLKTILSNTLLLQQLYKRYAFLRCDDELEQFLYHVLSLNAAEFNCFTNTFKKTKMQYRVLLMIGNARSLASCPLWIILTGSLCSTAVIEVEQGIVDFKFDHRNLGLLSTLRIGHGNAVSNDSLSPKWFLSYVVVRNEITGQCFRFHCNRWFGRGVDDGSLERLLVAEKQPQVDPSGSATPEDGLERTGKVSSRSQTPTRSRSPSSTRPESANHKPSKLRMIEIQQNLGEAVNAIVKYFYANPEAQSYSELTQLLCSPERGFVSVMVAVFTCGRQDSLWSTRLFRSYYPWEYIEKVCLWFYELIRMEDAKRLTREQRSLILQSCRLVRRISSNTVLGKDGKFQLFILITLREHILSGLLPLMAWTPITLQMYDEPSFLRTPYYLNYLSKLLSSLNEFQFRLEKSLTYGIE